MAVLGGGGGRARYMASQMDMEIITPPQIFEDWPALFAHVGMMQDSDLPERIEFFETLIAGIRSALDKGEIEVAKDCLDALWNEAFIQRSPIHFAEVHALSLRI
jgi:hypothetical protein